MYIFIVAADYGDIEKIEYRDLIFMIRSHKRDLFLPRFVILDDEFVSQHNELDELYASLYSVKDLKEILNLPVAQMKKTILDLPLGAKNAIKGVAATMIERRQFDSVQKIKALDEIFGTKLLLTLTVE